MKTLGQLKASSEKILFVGRDKVQAMRRDRRQQALLTKLGRACYDERSGRRGADPDANLKIDQLVAELSSIDEPGALDADLIDAPRAVENA